MLSVLKHVQIIKVVLCIPAFSGENGATDHLIKTHHLSTNGHGRVESHAEDLILKMSNSSSDA